MCARLPEITLSALEMERKTLTSCICYFLKEKEKKKCPIVCMIHSFCRRLYFCLSLGTVKASTDIFVCLDLRRRIEYHLFDGWSEFLKVCDLSEEDSLLFTQISLVA